MGNPENSPAVQQLLKSIDALEDAMAWICLDPVPSPTAAQLKAVQTFYPTENLVSVRRLLIAGDARIGPFDPEMIDDFAAAALRGTGLTWQQRLGAELRK